MTTTPASLTLRLLTMAGTAARLELERVLTLAGIRTCQYSTTSCSRASCVFPYNSTWTRLNNSLRANNSWSTTFFPYFLGRPRSRFFRSGAAS